MAVEGGYDPVIVFDWLRTHCTQRSDGRFVALGKQLLDDSHRDTFQRWVLAANTEPTFRVPLGRWTDILFTYGVEWYEFEAWASCVYGTTGYTEQQGSGRAEET